MNSFGVAVAAVAAAVVMVAALLALRLMARRRLANWLWAYLRGILRPRPVWTGPRHVMFCFVDHYEPRWRNASIDQERARVDRWLASYPHLCAGRTDADGYPPRHTFFFPEEEYRPEHIEKLTALCRQRLGEIEVHLHHDNDTSDGLRRKLREFTRTLVADHGALPVHPETGQPMWCFIHGNWALDNCRPDGRWCGVNDEITVLLQEGCYADFTFPSAPDATQPGLINQMYYAVDDPERPASHERGERMRLGGVPPTGPALAILQGVLGFNWSNRKYGVIPRIENSDIRANNPPTTSRVDSWVREGIHVEGKPDWVFVKVHTHGAQDGDMDTLLGEAAAEMFDYLGSKYNDGKRFVLHYVSAREMYNIAKAAEAGFSGSPNDARNYIVPPPTFVPAQTRKATDEP